MLVYKDVENKDILGYQCDMCNHMTMVDVIPNKHGEFHYICPKCGHHMKELNGDKKEETKMVNTYTVANAAKRLNCSTSTISRAIQDGRFHDCFMEAGYRGRPSWMIPSDQVEEWVTRGGFVQPAKKGGFGGYIPQKELKDRLRNIAPKEKPDPVRMIFDPEVKKEVPVLNFLSEEDLNPSKKEDEFKKRAVKRVAKEKKYVKVFERNPEVGKRANEIVREPKSVSDGDFDGDHTKFLTEQQETKIRQDYQEKMLESLRSSNDEPAVHLPAVSPVVRTDGGFNITFPTEMIEGLIREQMRGEISKAVTQLRVAFDLLNEELKKLEGAIA